MVVLSENVSVKPVVSAKTVSAKPVVAYSRFKELSYWDENVLCSITFLPPWKIKLPAKMEGLRKRINLN